MVLIYAWRAVCHWQFDVDLDLLFVGDFLANALQYCEGGATRRRALDVGTLLGVDADAVAELLQGCELGFRIEQKALKHERGFGPWTVMLGDVDAKAQFVNGDKFFDTRGAVFIKRVSR